MNRRELLKNSITGFLAGTFGWLLGSQDRTIHRHSCFRDDSYYDKKRSPGQQLRNVPPYQVKKVYLDGDDVTNRCFWADERSGKVRLYKLSEDGSFYIESIGNKAPINGRRPSDKRFAWVTTDEGERVFAEIDPVQVAWEERKGLVTIIEKEPGTALGKKRV